MFIPLLHRLHRPCSLRRSQWLVGADHVTASPEEPPANCTPRRWGLSVGHQREHMTWPRIRCSSLSAHSSCGRRSVNRSENVATISSRVHVRSIEDPSISPSGCRHASRERNPVPGSTKAGDVCGAAQPGLREVRCNRMTSVPSPGRGGHVEADAAPLPRRVSYGASVGHPRPTFRSSRSSPDHGREGRHRAGGGPARASGLKLPRWARHGLPHRRLETAGLRSRPISRHGDSRHHPAVLYGEEPVSVADRPELKAGLPAGRRQRHARCPPRGGTWSANSPESRRNDPATKKQGKQTPRSLRQIGEASPTH